MQEANWNDLRVFLAVAKAGSFGAAAQSLRLDPTTLSRRLRRLEQALQVTLFEQTRMGQSLTEAGEKLLVKAETMGRAAAAIGDDVSADQGISGTLRISVSEGFGSQFLTSYLGAFAKRHPRLSIELVANSGFLSPSKREADIAVLLSRPKAGPVICRKLAECKFRIYAHRDYLAHHGKPSTPSDLKHGHTLIGYVPDLIYAPELDYLGEFETGLEANISSSSINAQHNMLLNGAGIGVLPCFMGDMSNELQAVCPEHSIRRGFWIVTHRDTHKLRRVRAGKEWLLQCVREGRDRLDPPSIAGPIGEDCRAGVADKG